MCKFCRNWQICTFFISTRRSIKHACYYRFGQGYHHHSRQLFKKIKEERRAFAKKQKEEYHTLFTDFMSTLSTANKIKLNKEEDYLQYDFNISLKNFQLNLKDKKRADLINVSLTSMLTSAKISTFSQKVSLSVVGVEISQYIVDNKQYHDIIFTDEDSNKKILQVEYTHSPFLGKSDHKIEMKNEKEITRKKKENRYLFMVY